MVAHIVLFGTPDLRLKQVSVHLAKCSHPQYLKNRVSNRAKQISIVVSRTSKSFRGTLLASMDYANFPATEIDD